jgi:hypothetical protein
MQTRLEALEEAERWSAWGSSKFIAVEKDAGERVPFSRYDIHQLLVSATEIAFESPGVGNSTTREKVFLPGGGTDEVLVQHPADAGGWIGELLTLPGAYERFYQVGSWIVRVARPDYYSFIHGSMNQGDLAGLSRARSSGDSYRSMYEGSTACDDPVGAALSFLRGARSAGVPGEMARLLVAMYVSEAARNHRTWGVNLMLLDLLRSGRVTWGNLILGGLHPMAQGGTFAQGKTGMRGGRESAETWAHETSIAMAWLMGCSGLHISSEDGKSGDRWRDPVKAQAFVSATRRQLLNRCLSRLRNVGLTWDPT